MALVRMAADGTPILSADVPLWGTGSASEPASVDGAGSGRPVASEGDAVAVVGSFTVQGATYAVVGDGQVSLVAAEAAQAEGETGSAAGALAAGDAVAAEGARNAGKADGDQTSVAAMLAADDAADAADADADAADVNALDAAGASDGPVAEAFAVPARVSYDGVDYAVTSIGAYALAACDAPTVRIPASVASVDERAFRGSSVQRIEVDPANATYASYDGALYSADLARILLVPEGRSGQLRIASQTEGFDSGAFSHCALLEGFAVDADCPGLSSGDGLLYDATGTTLLRAPGGATAITIREGCTAIAAGAFAGCANLTSIEAPASVVRVSPQAFEEAPPTYVPALALARGGEGEGEGAESADESAASTKDDAESADEEEAAGDQGADGQAALDAQAAAPQAFAIMALGAIGDEENQVDLAKVTVVLPEGASEDPWRNFGLQVMYVQDEGANLGQASVSRAGYQENQTLILDDNGGTGGQGTVRVASGVPTTYFGPVVVPTRTGYIFEGYYTARSGGYMLFDAAGKGMGTASASADITTLYARWRAKDHYVNLDMQGGSGGTASIHPTYDQALPTVTPPSKADCYFMGYFTGKGGTGTQYYNHSGGGIGTWKETGNTVWGSLYAYWVPSTYTVTLNANGGTGSQTVTATYGKSLPNTTCAIFRNGYRLNGFFTSTSSGNKYYNATEVQANLFTLAGMRSWDITEDTTLYAQWTPKTYTITFNEQGGTNTAASTQTVTFGESSGNRRAPTRTGYTFLGYFDAASGGTKYFGASQGGVSYATGRWDKAYDTTLYAQWSGNTYTVKFNANSGSGGQSANVTATYGSAMPTISTTKPTRTGYTFQGWYDNADYTKGTQYYNANGGSARTWNKTATTTLYAGWKANTYTVKFNANSGSGGQSADVTATYGSAMPTISTTKPTRAGYTFQGWYDNADYTKGTQYYNANGGSARTWNKTDNTTLYAGWKANTYTVSFNANSGSGGQSANVTATYGSAMPAISTTKPTRAGYTFGGWYDTSASSGGTQYYNANGGSARTWNKTANTTLYARWTATSYTITYSLGGGSISGQKTSYTIETESFKLPTPSRTAYEFKGWTVTGASGTGAATAGTSTTIQKGTYGNLTATAKWTPRTYTITYELGGGSISGQKTSYTFEDADFALAKPTRTGYTFAGWTMAGATGAGVTTSGTTTTVKKGTYGNLRATAKWTANQYKVTLNANGGSGSHTREVTATYDAAMPGLAASNPTRSGYTFMGWYDNANYVASGAKQYYTAERASARNWDKTTTATLYAGWKANTYTVTFDERGGTTTAPASQQITFGMRFGMRALPTRTGYTFLGYYDAASGGKRYLTGDTGGGVSVGDAAWDKASNATLYAQWQAISYAISYNLNSTTGSFRDTVAISGQKESYTVEDTFTLAKPTRTGYSFTGWTGTDVTAPRVEVTVARGSTGERSYVAHWQPITYRIATEYNGGGVVQGSGGALVPLTYTVVSPTFSLPQLEKAGWTFHGWSGTGISGTQKDVTIATGSTYGDKSYEAQFTRDTYAITYDLAGGTFGGAANPGSYHVESADVVIPRPTRAGYEFAGWTGAAPTDRVSADGRDVVIPTGSTGSRAYTATWSIITYDLAYEGLEGATLAAENPGSYTVESPAITLANPAKDGYTFVGWAGRMTDTGEAFAIGDPMAAVLAHGSVGDRTYTAQWSLDVYQVTLDVGGGQVPDATARGWARDEGDAGLYRRDYSIESTRFQLPAVATKPGYATFEGWVGEGIAKPSRVVHVYPTDLRNKAYTGVFSGLESYTATLDLAGGAFASAPEGWSEGAGGAWARGFDVESAAFGLPTPTRAGHDFRGWALVGADGQLGEPDAGASVAAGTVGDRSFVAVWEARGFAVTWDYAGQTIDGATAATSTQAYGAPLAFPARPSSADPAREHYEFDGWFTERDGGQRVEGGPYEVEGDSTFYARWRPVEYAAWLHLDGGWIEQDGVALPGDPFAFRYTVEQAATLPRPTDEAGACRPVRTGMEFKGWVACDAEGTPLAGAVPEVEVTLPAGSSGERHYRATWAVSLRFEVPLSVSFRYDLADDVAFADAPYGPVTCVEGEGVELRSLSQGRLYVADLGIDVAGAEPDAIVTDRAKVSLRVMDASLADPGYGWVPLPRGSAVERVDPYDLPVLGFGEANALAPLGTLPLRYEIDIQDPLTTLVGETDSRALASIVFTVGLAG